MATRGTAILIAEENVLTSIEFNGDMYPEGFGDEFFTGLSRVTNTLEFDYFLEDFNSNNFRYREKMVYDMPNEDFFSNKGRALKHIDISDVAKKVLSDWLFLKNITDEMMTIEAYDYDRNKTKLTQINPGETIRFHYDSFPKKSVEYRIKP